MAAASKEADEQQPGKDHVESLRLGGGWLGWFCFVCCVGVFLGCWGGGGGNARTEPEQRAIVIIL